MMDLENNFGWLLLSVLFLVAFLYSSVGHGGASGYIAALALFGIAPASMKSSALVLNVFVSFVAFVQYGRAGHFRWKLFLPFALSSVPCAFLGAMVTIDPLM